MQSLGTVLIRMPLAGECFVDYRSVLLANGLTMLLGLETEMRLGMVTYKDTNEPYAKPKKVGVTISLTLVSGQLYLQPKADRIWYIVGTDFLFSTSEIAQVHCKLGHAPAGSVYSALRRAYSIKAGASDLEKSIETTKQCRGFQIFSKRPNSYRAVLPKRGVFNFDVAINDMFNRHVSILHAVCRQMYFSRATVPTKQDSFTVWTAFMNMLVIPYLRVPYNLWFDQATAFLSTQLTTLANVLD